jgi:hypothetical protein
LQNRQSPAINDKLHTAALGNFGRVAPGVDDLLASFADWAAAERVARAAAERSRARSLGDQAARSATWTGILVDLAERAAEVTVTAGGSTISGRLVCVGRDFLLVDKQNNRPCLVSVTAVDTLAPQPAGSSGPATSGRPLRPAAPGGSRGPAVDLSMLSALDSLAAERAPVSLRAGTTTLAGDLLAAGVDAVTVAASPHGRLVHVPAAALAWCELR